MCDSGAEICVANSSAVERLDVDPIGQIQLRPFCGNTVTADFVCFNVSLADSDMPSTTSNHLVKVTCAVVPDLHDKFILTASVIDSLSRSNVHITADVNQAQANGENHLPAVIGGSDDIDDDMRQVSNLLYHRTKILGQDVYQLLVPESHRAHVLKMGHDSFGGHMGFKRTKARINYTFHWPGLRENCEQYVKTCGTCQLKARATYYDVDWIGLGHPHV